MAKGYIGRAQRTTVMIAESGKQIIKEKAESLKDELIKERNRLTALLSEIDSFLSEHPDESYPVPTSFALQIEEPISIIGAVTEIIKTHGPVKTPDLLKLLTQSGQKVNGKNPIQTLYSTLHKEAKRKSPRVERKKGLWCLIQQN
jgi:hypothetical protein